MIKNRDEILSHGFIKGRELILEIIEYTLKRLDPRVAIKNRCTIKNNDFIIGDNVLFNLNKINNIYVVGAGKATFQMAAGIQDLIGDKIKEGIIAVKNGEGRSLEKIKVIESSHPFIDRRSLKVSEEIFKIAEKAKKDDVVFCLISGGSSALCVSPVSDISFEDKKKVNELLLYCGADIYEINTVRRHLSSIKGGRLRAKISPAKIVNLTVSDAVGDELKINTDWTSPDHTTFKDAINVLKKYPLS